MAETDLKSIFREGIPSGLNRIKLKKEKRLSSDDSVHSASDRGGVPSRLPPMGRRGKDSDGHWKKIDGGDGNKQGMSKGKKIARWFTSYLTKDSRHKSNDISGNNEVSSSEVKMLNKEGFGRTQQTNRKDSSLESAGTRKLPLNFKSFSHELGPKGGFQPTPAPTRAHSYNDLKEMLGSLRSRFDAAKEMVNSELATFAEDVEEVIGQQRFSPSARRQSMADLLNLARNCIEMTSSELREKCEGIVQDLAEKRQQCQAGLVKQLFTRMLFILTRCTRLLQFEKDSEPIDESSLHKFRQCLENIPAVEMNWVPKPDGTVAASKDNMKKREKKRQMKGKNVAMAFTFPDRTWPRTEELPDESETSLEHKSVALTQKSSSPKSQVNVQSSQSSVTEFDSHNFNVPQQGKLFPSDQEDNLLLCHHAGGGSPGRLFPKPSNGSAYEQDRVSDDSVICRICEEVVPTSHLETHSYICAYADKCDLKGFDVDERLSKLADVLEQIIDSSTLSYNAACCGSPDLLKVQTTNSAVGSGCQSPKVIEWHNKGVEAMFEDLHEMDTACIDESHLLGTSNLKGHLGLKYSHFGATSSNGSLTSMSSTNTPRANHFDLFWLEHNNSSEPEDVQQMTELAEVARHVANVNLTSEAASEHLLEYMHNLQDILQNSKLKALVIDTFGSHIENLLREKYLLAGELMDNRNPRHASKHIMESLLASPSSVMSTPTHKDRISIDDFVIIKPISKGAFGKVFLARKRTTGDLFAIKVLNKLDMLRKNDVERILAERNILITVRNPFVVRFFYSFTCRDNLYLVMEYLNGGDLYSLLSKVGCLEEEVARTYIAELVLALEYLHTLGIVHRDLKPDNILIAQDGHIKLTDFGLSKIGLINSTVDLSGLETDSTTLTEADDLHPSFEHTIQREDRNQRSAVGTPDYLAPEILLGTEHGYAADWWSVGIILFELITGIPPFSAESPEIIFDNILNKKMPWPIVPDDMSHEAQDLINRFLIHDPDQRLGANGASEVKTHPFFAGVNWDTLALQKAAFVPHPDSAEDTSYFLSRYSQISNGIPVPEDENLSDCSSDSTASCSNSGLEIDECGDLKDFNSSPLNLSLINFSFKNLSQLAKINYDVLLQRGPSNCSSPARGPDP